MPSYNESVLKATWEHLPSPCGARGKKKELSFVTKLLWSFYYYNHKKTFWICRGHLTKPFIKKSQKEYVPPKKKGEIGLLFNLNCEAGHAKAYTTNPNINRFQIFLHPTRGGTYSSKTLSERHIVEYQKCGFLGSKNGEVIKPKGKSMPWLWCGWHTFWSGHTYPKGAEQGTWKATSDTYPLPIKNPQPHSRTACYYIAREDTAPPPSPSF